VNKVIETVMDKLVGKLPTRLRSRGCLSRILIEAKSVAAQQVAQSMLDGGVVQNIIGNCLHMDATTKYHHHYRVMGYVQHSDQINIKNKCPLYYSKIS